jgi:hypothetical protein
LLSRLFSLARRWALALRAFAGLGRGWPCGRGRCFIPERGKHVPPGSRWLSGSISAADLDTVATLFFDEQGIVFVSCTRPIFGPAGRVRGRHPAWLDHKKTRFLPAYIRLEMDGEGVPIWPDGHVTDLAKLGPKMARYFVQGALEFILPGMELPTIIEPMGAVPKKGQDNYRAIADGRVGNKSISDWGTRVFPARELASALSWRAIVNGFDVNDGYHIAPFPGCTGELVWGFGIVDVRRFYDGDPEWEPPMVMDSDWVWRPAHGPHGAQFRFVFGWRLHLGCWPGKYAQTCDKSYCAMYTDGCIARWAVAHFCQKPAGCPLNCIALCLLRHAALRRANTGELRGASVRPMLGGRLRLPQACGVAPALRRAGGGLPGLRPQPGGGGGAR